MRPLTDDEMRTLFEKLQIFLGADIKSLIDRIDEPHTFRLIDTRVFYLRLPSLTLFYLSTMSYCAYITFVTSSKVKHSFASPQTQGKISYCQQVPVSESSQKEVNHVLFPFSLHDKWLLQGNFDYIYHVWTIWHNTQNTKYG